MEDFVRKIFSREAGEEEDSKEHSKEHRPDVMEGRMYILTNAAKTYGAAGILNKRLVQEFAGGQDFFILPSSIHETIFVRAHDLSEKEAFDSMVAEVNEEQVDAEERLSDHCYYYDGRTGEIRMCA